MQLSKREGLLLITFVVFLIIYLFYGQIYKPLVFKTQNLMEANNELMAMGHMVEKAAYAMDDNIDSQKQAFAKFNEKIPEQAYIPETIKFIEELASKHKLDLLMAQYVLSEDTLRVNKVGECQESLFEIDLSGSYLNLTKFIGEIENASRLYNIESISMTMESVAETNEELMAETLVYNPQAIVMKVFFKSYYDNISWEGIKGVEEILYSNETPVNPFATR